MNGLYIYIVYLDEAASVHVPHELCPHNPATLLFSPIYARS